MCKVQYCIKCNEPTDRCEDDSIFIEDTGPLCEKCACSLVSMRSSYEYLAEIRVCCTADDGHADKCIGFEPNKLFPRWCGWKNADGDCTNKKFFNKLSKEVLG